MTVAGNLVVGVTADMSKFTSQVEAGAVAAGNAASKSVGNSFSKGVIANAGAIKSAGQKMSLGLTAPLALIGTLAVKSAAQFESSMSQTAAALDKPMSGMQGLSDLALEFGKSTVFSAGEVASAMTELAKGGFSEAEIAGGSLKSTLDLAAAGGIGLADSAGYITAAMNGFNIEAKDSASIADALAGAADASAADVSDMAAALENVSATASLANQELPDVTGTLAALAQNGTKGAEAGTTLRSALTSLIKPTSAAQTAMKQYGIDVYDAQGKMRTLPAIAGQLQDGFKGVSDEARNAALATIFGTYGIKAAKVLYTEGAAGIEKYAAASREAGAAQKAAAARMGPTQKALEELSGAWETLMIELGTAAGPVVQGIANGLKTLTEAFSSLPDGVKSATIAFAAFAAAAGPILIAVGSLAGAIGKLKAFGAASSALCGAGAIKGGGGCLSQLPGVAGSAGKGAGAMTRLSTAVKTVAGGVGLVGGGWVAAGLALAAFIAYQQQSNAETQKQIGKTKEFQAAREAAQSGDLQAGKGVSSADNRNLAATEMILKQAQATGVLTSEQERLNQANVQYSQQLQASNAVIAQRNAGTLRGVQLTQQSKAALQEQINKSRGLSEAMVANQAPAQDVLRTVQQQRDAFMRNAVAMGYSKAQAQVMAKAYGLIPKDVKTYIQAKNAEETQAKIKGIDRQLAAIARKRTQIQISGKDPQTKQKELDALDKKAAALNRRKTRLEVKAEGVDKSAKDVDKLSGKVKSLKGKEIKVQADTAQADTPLKKSQQLLDKLDATEAEPKVAVDSNADEVAANTSERLSSIPDETVYVRVVETGGGGGGGGDDGVEGQSLGRGDDVRGLSFGSRAASVPRGPAFAGFTNPYDQWIKVYLPLWQAALTKAGADAAYGQYRAYEDAQLKEQRAIEDQDRKWLQDREDVQRAWEDRQQSRIASKQRAEQDARDASTRKSSPGGEDRTTEEIKKIKKLADKRRAAETKFDNQQVRRSRKQERLQTARSRRRETDARAEQRGREDAERAAQAAWTAEQDRVAEADRVAQERVAANESVTQSLVSQRDQLRDRLSQTVQWGPSPARLIRDLNKSKAILQKYSTDLQKLQAQGLSKEAIAAMSQMDPKEAGRLASRLLQDPSLVGSLNSAYEGLITASTDVANKTTAYQFEGVGAGMTQGILTGLKGGEASVLKYITDLADASLDAIKTRLGIRSPSTAFAEVGENIGLGLVEGMGSTEAAVRARTASLVAVPSSSIPNQGTSSAPIVNNIYPSQRMDERETAVMVSRELAWMVGL
jgi:TP901 family phage tail tape measure protein